MYCMRGEGPPGRHDPVHHPPGIQHQLKSLLHTAAQCMEHSLSDGPQQTTSQ